MKNIKDLQNKLASFKDDPSLKFKSVIYKNAYYIIPPNTLDKKYERILNKLGELQNGKNNA